MRVEEEIAIRTVHDGVSFGISASRNGGKGFVFARIYDEYWDHYHQWTVLYEAVHNGIDAEKQIRIYARSYPKHMTIGVTEHG